MGPWVLMQPKLELWVLGPVHRPPRERLWGGLRQGRLWALCVQSRCLQSSSLLCQERWLI